MLDWKTHIQKNAKKIKNQWFCLYAITRIVREHREINTLRRGKMSLRLGDIAPNFQQDSSEGQIDFYEFLGSGWGILFSHPADFTPVCTTELGFTAKLKDEFAKRGVKAIALSVDDAESHKSWIQDINETQNTTVNFPIKVMK
jgi:hypothetical protein